MAFGGMRKDSRMSSTSGGTESRIEALRKREQALKTAIARELIRQQKKRERDHGRLCSIVGAALVRNAAEHPDFELMLKSVLKTSATLGDSEKKLLRAKGWL
jgi:uncharacterized membrane protein